MNLLAIIANHRDNVATVVQAGKIGNTVIAEIESKEVKTKLISDIPCFHKYALSDIKKGEDVLKYGEVIGYASRDILAGEHVHIQNTESNRGRGDIIEGK